MKTLMLLLVGSLIFTVGCSKEKNYAEREIHLVSPEKIFGFDPIHASDQYSSNEVGKVYEGLYEFHPFKRPYELMPNLADTLPTVSEDGLTYTFKLKKGVLFHDSPAFKDGIGREMNADDFLYTMRRLADPKLQAKGWWLFDDKIMGLNEWRDKNAALDVANYEEPVEGLKKIDNNTVEIKLKRPYPQFLYALAMPYSFVVAKEAVEHHGKEFLNYPVGTGPFILNKFDQSNTIVYHRNPKFREKFFPSEGEEGDDKLGLLADAGKKLPLLDKVVVHFIIESQPKWQNFHKAKVDILEIKDANISQTIDEKRDLKPEHKSKGIRLFLTPQLDITFFAFNHEDPLFKKNIKLRQAMSLAYNRADANKLFYENTAYEAQSVIPPGLGGYRKEFKNPYVKYDIELAKKLLAEAGYPDGKGLPDITVQTRNEPVARQQIELFAKSLEKIGIKIKVGMNTWPELINKVTKKQHQMYTMAWGADYPDAENFLGLLYCPNQSPGSNGSNHCNPAFDEQFKAATVLQDTPERSAMYEKMNETIAHEVPWVFGFNRTKLYLTHAWIKNYKTIEFQHSQVQYLNVDLEVKKELSKKF
ncbi:MAG TPA: ABC transporter substrate-binding protein [Bacteriovoracaceae bacterium]|nr:ABC transporter substrate-binding protein [Bacteriovoracaceae bacterium]